jgi:F-type H+-transporting ATPase subunit b
VELNPNLFQVLIQLGIYLFLIFVLKTLYFAPILELLKKREALTSGRVEGAAELRKQTETLRAQYDAQIASARDRMDQERHEALMLVKERTEKTIHEAKSGIEKKSANHHREISSEAQKLRLKLPELSADVSKEIVNAITNSRVVRA